MGGSWSTCTRFLFEEENIRVYINTCLPKNLLNIFVSISIWRRKHTCFTHMFTKNYWSFERKTYTWWSPQKLTFMKSGGFHEIWWISCGFQVKSTYKSYKSNISRKTLQFYGVLWEGYVMFSHEIRRFRKTNCRNGKPYVWISLLFVLYDKIHPGDYNLTNINILQENYVAQLLLNK